MAGGTVSSGHRRAGFALAFVLALAGVAHAQELPIEQASLVIDAPLLTPDDQASIREGTGEIVIARIDLSDQMLRLYVDGALTQTFPVSTARRGYITPVGEYQPQWLSRYHRSKKYNNAPMPWAVFFHGGYAIHGTTEVRQLGRPASHGCVRLHPDNAKLFFKLVQNVGRDNVLITVAQ